jgi:hypothetical protein
MVEPIIFYENKNCLFLSEEVQGVLKKTPRSILWVHNGLYGLLPSEVIQNELQVRADRKKLWDLEPNHEKWKPWWQVPLGFRWAETEDVPNGARIAELLTQSSGDSGTSDPE